MTGVGTVVCEGLETMICEGWECEKCWDVFNQEVRLAVINSGSQIYAFPYSLSAMWCEWERSTWTANRLVFISVSGACCGDSCWKQSLVVNSSRCYKCDCVYSFGVGAT